MFRIAAAGVSLEIKIDGTGRKKRKFSARRQIPGIRHAKMSKTLNLYF